MNMTNISNLTAALNITRRMFPQDINKTLVGLIRLMPQLGGDLLQRTDVPLQLKYDDQAKAYFIACMYNRECDSHRSPLTNMYFPDLPHSNPYKPTEHLRKLEIEYNKLLDSYRCAYYGGGVSSVYLWALPNDDGFAAVFAIRKELEKGEESNILIWNTVHVVEVIQSAINVQYKMISSLLLFGKLKSSPKPECDLGMSLSKSLEQQKKIGEPTNSTPHILIIGKMIEEAESSMRKNISCIYMAKTQEILNGLRRREVKTKSSLEDRKNLSKNLKDVVEEKNKEGSKKILNI